MLLIIILVIMFLVQINWEKHFNIIHLFIGLANTLNASEEVVLFLKPTILDKFVMFLTRESQKKAQQEFHAKLFDELAKVERWHV